MSDDIVVNSDELTANDTVVVDMPQIGGTVEITFGVGPQGLDGDRGPRGYLFTPTVSEEGVISWTNDGNLPNPEPISIKGPKGDKGDTFVVHICGSNEYDPTTRVPTVQNPETNVFYLVPVEDPQSSDLFSEWVYVNDAWELFGSAKVDLSGYATKADTVLETTFSRGRKAGSTVGNGSFAFGDNVEASGEYSVAFGANTVSSGRRSYAEGNSTYAVSSNAHAEGNKSRARNANAHAEGYDTDAKGICSHAEGLNVMADGQNSHAEGSYTLANGIDSHAEGSATRAISDGAHAEGLYTIARSGHQHVQGKYNVEDNNGIYADIVGNGVGDDTRSNAYALDWDGNGHYMGDIYVKANTNSTGGTKVATVDDIPEVPVQDVQVNGTSVVTDGVANVPVASSSAPGVMRVNSSRGFELDGDALSFKNASDAQLKAGTNQYRPITPNTQYAAAFYGLAKAAGADMAKVSGATVGIYPEAQKSAISTMLNGSVTVSGTTPTITALSGIQYVCGEVSTLDITLPASGIVDVVFESGSTPTVLTVTPATGMTVEWANGFDSTALEANTLYELNIKMVGSKCLGVAGSWS